MRRAAPVVTLNDRAGAGKCRVEEVRSEIARLKDRRGVVVREASVLSGVLPEYEAALACERAAETERRQR